MGLTLLGCRSVEKLLPSRVLLLLLGKTLGVLLLGKTQGVLLLSLLLLLRRLRGCRHR